MKKYVLLVLAAMYISTLCAAAKKGILEVGNQALTRQGVMALTLRDRLLEGPISLVTQYLGGKWKAQAIEMNDPVYSIAVSPEGEHIAVGTYYGRLALHSPETGNGLLALKGHKKRVCSLDFSDDGELLASGSEDCTTKIWNTSTGDLLENLECAKLVHQVKFLKENILASSSYDNTIMFWNMNTGKYMQKNMEFYDLSFFAVTLDSQRLAAGTSRYHKGLSLNLNYSPKSMKVPNDEDCLAIWDTNSFERTCTVKTVNHGVSCMTFSPNGKQLAVATYEWPLFAKEFCPVIKLINVDTGKLMYRLKKHTETVNDIAYSPTDDYLVSGGVDEVLLLWSSRNGQLLRELGIHKESILSLAFSPDGKYLVSGSYDKTVRIAKVPENIEEKEDSCSIS